MPTKYNGEEPNPDFWDSIEHSETKDAIHERMDELKLNEIIDNYSEIVEQIEKGKVEEEYASILGAFATLSDADRAIAFGVWPKFEELLTSYVSLVRQQEEDFKDSLGVDPEMLDRNLLAAFGDGFELAKDAVDTDARLLRFLSKYLRTSNDPPAPTLPWELRIGASRFIVPPVNINVNQSYRVGSLSGGALRQQSSPKFNSGHKETVIDMTLYFPNHESIWGIDNDTGELEVNFNDGDDATIDRFISSLRGLITQFKYAPILPIRNHYLNSTYGITGVTLHSMSLSTIEGFPFVVAVNLQMLSFNHKVYLPMIEDFNSAVHWGRYRQYLGRAAEKINSTVNIGFLKERVEEKEIEVANAEILGGPTTNTVNTSVIEYEEEPSNKFKSPYSEFTSTGDWKNGKQLNLYFPKKTPGRIFAPDMSGFRHPKEDDATGREKNTWEYFLGYLGVDVDTYPEATYEGFDNYSDEITSRPKEREILQEYLKSIGNAAEFMDIEHLKKYTQEVLVNFAKENNYPDTLAIPDDIRIEIEKNVRIAWFTYIFENYRDTPFFKNYLSSADYNTGRITIKEWDVPMERLELNHENVIITGLTVSMANNIARLQVQMQEEPTHQHIGGRDTRLDIALTVMGEEDLIRLQRMFKHISGLAQLEQAHGVMGFLGVKNALTALAGIKYVLPMSFEIDTIPGYPHIYNVKLSFVDFDVEQQKRETLSSDQQRELVESFSKRNPFLRIKQQWSAFSAYPDFPLAVRDDKTGDIVGHLDPDYFYRAYKMIDDDIVNWDLDDSVTADGQRRMYPGFSAGSGGDPNGSYHGNVADTPASEGFSKGIALTDAEGGNDFWTESDSRSPTGYDVGYDATGGRLDESLKKRGYKHMVQHVIGMFSEDQTSASLVSIAADGFSLGTLPLDADDAPAGDVKWIGEDAFNPVRYQLHEDVASTIHNQPFSPTSIPLGGYMQPHADNSANPYKQFELMMRDTQYRDVSGRMVRAFPTYMLWLIDEGGNFGGVKLFDNFYGLQSVIDMSINRSQDTLGDTLVLRISNLYQKLTTEYKNQISDGEQSTKVIDLFEDRLRNMQSGMTDAIVDLDSIRLKPGVRVHLRLGYSANPNRLETVFNGTITEVKQGDIVEVIAQSDAIELSPYINTTNKSGHSGKIDGAFNTGLWLSEPRDLMVRLLSMGSSTFKESIAFATQGMIFSENRFGIRHFGSILYPPLTEEEEKKNRNIRTVVGGWMSDVSDESAGDIATGSGAALVGSVDIDVGTGDGEAFDAQLGNAVGVRSPVLGVMQQMWQNSFAFRDYEVFKRNIYPGNGLGVAQYLGGDLLDGGIIWAESVSGSEPGATELASTTTTGHSQAYVENQSAIETAADPENSQGDEEDNSLDPFSAENLPGGKAWALWANPTNPLGTVQAAKEGWKIGQSLFGEGPYKNHPLLQMFGIAGTDNDLEGFDEVSFRAQTYMKSVWDLFQLCAALLPNYIVAVRPFEDRSTVFYGKPHWLYTSGVIPITTGIPKGKSEDIDSVNSSLVELQRRAAEHSNPLADLETQLQFFKGLSSKDVDPNNTTEGLAFDGSLEDVTRLGLQHRSGFTIPYKSGPAIVGKHYNIDGHIEDPSLKDEHKMSSGFVEEGSFHGATAEMEQYHIRAWWTTTVQQTPPPTKDVKILVFNNDTGKACVCAVGPALSSGGTELKWALSPDAAHIIGASDNANIFVGLLPDNSGLGPATSITFTTPTPERPPQDGEEPKPNTSEQGASVNVVDATNYNGSTGAKPISDYEGKEDAWIFNEETIKNFPRGSLNTEDDIYEKIRPGIDLKGDMLENGKIASRVAFDFGWLVDEVPVWVDPYSGVDSQGQQVIDNAGIYARRIYDPDYNAFYMNDGKAPEDDVETKGVEVFANQNKRSLADAEAIWDTIRTEIWDLNPDWLEQTYEQNHILRHGNADFAKSDFYRTATKWLQFMWKNPVARAWVVLTADRQSDWTSAGPFDVDSDLAAALGDVLGGNISSLSDAGGSLVGAVVNSIPLVAGGKFIESIGSNDSHITLGPAEIGASKDEGWDISSSPFIDSWMKFVTLDTEAEEITWREDYLNWLEENFEPGNEAQTADEMAVDAVKDLYGATIGKLITTAANTMSGLVALFRLGLQQLGQGLEMAGDMQRQANILNRVFNDSIYYAAGEPGSLLRLADNPFTREYGEPVVEIREPFQRMHYISSFQHILSNNISETLNGVATVVTASSDGKYPVTVYFDKGAPSERQTEKAVETGLFWDNARGSGFFGFLHPLLHPIEAARGATKSGTGSSDEILSKRVGLYHLKEGLKDIYSGEILVLGDAEIRPFDLVFLSDVYTRTYGMFEVAEVTHHFTPETGFVTSITPNALVTINDPARWSVISWVWSWWAVKNVRDDLRNIVGIKVDRGSQLSNDGVTTEELAESLDTQLRGHVQYTHGGSALARDLVVNRTTGNALSSNEAYQQIEAPTDTSNNIEGRTVAMNLLPSAYFGQALMWPAWKWVRDNLLDQHGCYIQYLTRDGSAMDAGLSYAQGVSVGRHHSTNLLPGILGLEVDTFSPEGNRRITTDDLLKSLGWQEVEVFKLKRDLSWWINQTNNKVLELTGTGPDPVGLGDKPIVKFGTVLKVTDGDTIELTDGNKIRLSGIDTEEIEYKFNLDLNAQNDRSILALEHLSRILIDEQQEIGHPTTIAYRINPSQGFKGRDMYGRDLGVVFHRVPAGVSAEMREATLRSFAGERVPDLPVQPFITWDQSMPDGRPYTANWDLTVAGLADISLDGIKRNDPDRGAWPRGDRGEEWGG